MKLSEFFKRNKKRTYVVRNNGTTRRQLSEKYPDQKRMRRVFGSNWKPILG